MSDTDWDWTDHIPSGGAGMDGYGYVTCACGWSSDVDEHDDWVTHIRRMGADSLDAALADAEAALQTEWCIDIESEPGRHRGVAWDWHGGASQGCSKGDWRPTPAAALRALAVKLRERAG